jgi:hypothetical protein
VRIVADTCTRDSLHLIEMQFPTFANGISRSAVRRVIQVAARRRRMKPLSASPRSPYSMG